MKLNVRNTDTDRKYEIKPKSLFLHTIRELSNKGKRTVYKLSKQETAIA